MTYVAAALSIALFLVCFGLFGVVPAAARIVASARGAFAAIRSPDLSDDAKEAAAQRASLALLGGLVSLLLRGAAAVAGRDTWRRSRSAALPTGPKGRWSLRRLGAVPDVTAFGGSPGRS